MVQIYQDFIPAGRRNRPGYKLEAQYITIHDTANSSSGANARMHAQYLKSDTAANALVSWHFTVDSKNIYQHLPLTENGWHAGDGASGPGNRTSIGIEICENSDGDRSQAEANAAWLVAFLVRSVKTLRPFPGCMKQHYDWNQKNCPRVLRGRPGGWSAFLKLCEAYMVPVTVHVVEPGESLSRIGGIYKVSVDDLVSWNVARYPALVKAPGLIYPGWELRVVPPEQASSVQPDAPLAPNPSMEALKKALTALEEAAIIIKEVIGNA